MGHNKKHTPKHGSRMFWPRVRAKRIYPRVRHKSNGKPMLQGFAGYKAGMTSVFVVDNRAKSPTKGEEVKYAVTVLETPPLKVFGLRLYDKSPYGTRVAGEIWADSLDTKFLGKRLRLPKKHKHKLDTLKQLLPSAVEVKVLAHTQPAQTGGLSKKVPDVFELGVGGDINAAFDYASSILGKEIAVSDVFKSGEVLDVHAITKGKGFQGVVKRYGVKMMSHKAEFSRRKIGCMAPEGMVRVGWWVLQSGQQGYHARTEHNKQILKIGDAKEENITPRGGFVKYGNVPASYILVAGSVPGPKRRLIQLSHPSRSRKNATTVAPEISHISLRSQQI